MYMEESPSFKTHCDHFSNFIIQCVGETQWRVYKNKQTSLLACRNDKELNYDIMEIEWEGVLLLMICSIYLIGHIIKHYQIDQGCQ